MPGPAGGSIVTDDDNFPTDRYVLAGLARPRGLRAADHRHRPRRGVSTERRGGRRWTTGRRAGVAVARGLPLGRDGRPGRDHRGGPRRRGADAVGPVPLGRARCRCRSVSAGADLAVGCTYKHLNGGPGAPAFLYVRADLQPTLRQPIWGWFGQRDQFAMGPDYDPVDGIDRFLVGTPPVLGLYGALEGARLTAEAGIERIAAKARALTGVRGRAGRRLAGTAGLPARLTRATRPPRRPHHAAPPAGLAGRARR